MSAGRGVMHSEFNHAKDRTTHFLQIWIEPERARHRAGLRAEALRAADKRGRLRLVASPGRRDGSVTIHQDASVYAGLFDGDESAALCRSCWLSAPSSSKWLAAPR
jgi:redox-sensitive bicupin YhaK (pirin superfamily)